MSLHHWFLTLVATAATVDAAPAAADVAATAVQSVVLTIGPTHGDPHTYTVEITPDMIFEQQGETCRALRIRRKTFTRLVEAIARAGLLRERRLESAGQRCAEDDRCPVLEIYASGKVLRLEISDGLTPKEVLPRARRIVAGLQEIGVLVSTNLRSEDCAEVEGHCGTQ